MAFVKTAQRPGPAGLQTLAVIDIGSSAIRMEIAEISTDGRVTALENLKRAVPLGRDCFATGKIDRRTINLAIDVLRDFQNVLEPYGVRHIRAVATNAVREASNQELFVERVYMATDIAVDVITGAEESRLLYTAVRHAFARAGLTLDDDALIIEQGAGHLDATRLKKGEVLLATSFPLGTLRVTGAVANESRGGAATLDLMKQFIGHALSEINHALHFDEIGQLVMLGAEVRFAAERLQKKEAAGVRKVRRNQLLKFARGTAKLRPEQIAEAYGLPFEECESLVPCLMSYAEIVKRTPVDAIVIPPVSLRDGLILDYIADPTGKSELDAQIYASAENLGRRYQFDEPHARHVTELATILFDALAEEHGLSKRERRLLRVASLVHDIGLFISGASHHKHSEYLINAADIFGIRDADKAIVASVARYHRRALPQATHMGFVSLARKERATVSKLAALLRIADALDRSHSQRIHLKKVELSAEELVLTIDGDQDLALERLSMRAKADLFEEVFGRTVLLQPQRFEDA